MKKFFVLFLVASLIPALVGCSFWGGDDDDGTPVIALDSANFKAAPVYKTVKQSDVVFSLDNKTITWLVAPTAGKLELTCKKSFGTGATASPSAMVKIVGAGNDVLELDLSQLKTPGNHTFTVSGNVVISATIEVRDVSALAPTVVTMTKPAIPNRTFTQAGTIYTPDDPTKTIVQRIDTNTTGGAVPTIKISGAPATTPTEEALTFDADKKYGDNPSVAIEDIAAGKSVSGEEAKKYVEVKGDKVTVHAEKLKKILTTLPVTYRITVVSEDGKTKSVQNVLVN